MIHTIYTSTFGEWFIDFMKRIGDFIAGGGATFEVFERIILAILFILIGWGLSLLYKLPSEANNPIIYALFDVSIWLKYEKLK